jgi:hypothetical protein
MLQRCQSRAAVLAVVMPTLHFLAKKIKFLVLVAVSLTNEKMPVSITLQLYLPQEWL